MGFYLNRLDVLGDFLQFFNAQMAHQVNWHTLAPKLIQNLQSYYPPALSPLALITCAAPLALIIQSSWKYLVRIILYLWLMKCLFLPHSPFATCRALL